jgi:aspartate kinase
MESPDERLVVVVSAQEGLTDKLEARARKIVDHPNSSALDLLWSTGELRSVALLALHLQNLGISAAALNIHEAGLALPGGACELGPSAHQVHINPRRLRSLLERHPVAVVPGFFATDAAGAVVTLGRGGSDLTAVLLAKALDACRCELLKDVPGYFTSDPHRDRMARHLPQLTFDHALALEEDGCELVQRQAIQTAALCNLPLVIRSLDDSAPFSRVVPVEQECAWENSISSEAVA